MKIYTEVNYEWVGGRLVMVSEKSHEHEGDVAACKGGGGQPTQTWEASDKYAALSRQQFDDLKERFYPYHQKLISQTNGATMDEEVSRATGATVAATDRQRNAMKLNQSRMGTVMTESQQNAVDRSFGINKAAALANARNRAREKVESRDLAINTGGMGSINQIKNGAA